MLFGDVEIVKDPIFGRDPFNRAFEGGRNDGDGGAFDMADTGDALESTNLLTNESFGRA